MKAIIIKDLFHRQVKDNQTPVVAFNLAGQQHEFEIKNCMSEAYPVKQFSFLGFSLVFGSLIMSTERITTGVQLSPSMPSVISAPSQLLETSSSLFTTGTENTNGLLLLSDLGTVSSF